LHVKQDCTTLDKDYKLLFSYLLVAFLVITVVVPYNKTKYMH